MRRAVVFRMKNEAHDIDGIRNPMTVGRLKEILEEIEDSALVICTHNIGGIYGTLSDEADVLAECGDEWERVDAVW